MDEKQYLLMVIGDLEFARRLLLEKIALLEARVAELEAEPEAEKDE